MGCGSSTPAPPPPSEQQEEDKPTVQIKNSEYSFLTNKGRRELDWDAAAFQHKPNEYDFLFKILLIGNSGVGKSALIMRFADDIFHSSFASTIGVDFKLRTVELNGQKIKLQIWDTAGQERFKTVTNAYFRGSHGIILVYDITKESSFAALDDWLMELGKSAPSNCLKLIIGNKCDLAEDREVSHEVVQEYAEKHGIHFFETSAKDTTNVNQAFLHLAGEIRNKINK
mmetsp:Transcript_2600/g.4007  ORF Transcript_2600/g.4007 Transcript_2600/m.4007 type:complete len:227 (-) Transcript_2600:56-736(-)